jgi:hypothetical protein
MADFSRSKHDYNNEVNWALPTTPSQPPRAPSAPVTQVASTGSGTGSGLSKTMEADIFDQLTRLSQLCVQKPRPSHHPETHAHTHALALIGPITAASWASTKG